MARARNLLAVVLAAVLAVTPWRAVLAQEESGGESTWEVPPDLETPTADEEQPPETGEQPSPAGEEPEPLPEEFGTENFPIKLPERLRTGKPEGEAPPAEGEAPLPAEQAEEDVLGEEEVYTYEAVDLGQYGYGEVPYVRVETPDGWKLALYHYPPPSEFAKLYPLILVHGEGFNRNIWDFDKNHSLARTLADNLFDVWVVELRGHGYSAVQHAAPSPAVEWTFEDYITDVNTVVDYVLAQTGAAQVMLVGHSTGGVIVYGMMESPQYNSKIAGGLTLGAPTHFRLPNDTLAALFVHREKVYDQEEVDLRRGTYLPAPFPENTETVYSVLFFNDAFLDPERVEEFVDIGLEPVRTKILKQFADWFAEEKAYDTTSEQIRYDEDLGIIRAPLCVFVGWRDNIAQPENVIESLQHVEPALLRLRLFGKMEGHQDYYGHVGLLLNDYARMDVYPQVGGCLDDAALQLEEGYYAAPEAQAGTPLEGDEDGWRTPAPGDGWGAEPEDTPPPEETPEEPQGGSMDRSQDGSQEMNLEEDSAGPGMDGVPESDGSAPSFEIPVDDQTNP